MQLIRRDSLWLVCLLVFSACLAITWHSIVGFVRDDAYITYRYSANIAAGRGFVYNPGEYVYGTSSPGMALLLAAWLKLSPDVLGAAMALDILAGALSLFFVWKLLEHASIPVAARAFSLFVLTWSDKLLLHLMEGMETALVVACMLAALYFMVKEKPVLAGLAAGAMLWFRPDSALWVAAIAIVFLASWRISLYFLAVTGLTYLPWLLFAWSYFGTVIPLTVIAKQVAYAAHAAPWPVRAWIFFNWMTPFTPGIPSIGVTATALATLLLAALGAWMHLRHPAIRVLALFCSMQAAALVALNMTVDQRYFTTCLYALLILFALGLHAVFTGSAKSSHWRLAALAAVYAALAFVLALPRIEHVRDYQHYVYDLSLKQMGLWFESNTPAGSVIELEPLGYAGYYAGRRMLDDVGLATPSVVTLKRAGKDTFQVVDALKPDYVVLHCDDARRAPQAFGYQPVARFDPLQFEAGKEWADDAIQRNACYEIDASTR